MYTVKNYFSFMPSRAT